MLTKFKLTPINKYEKIKYSGKVYDLEVEENHSYCANNKIVHNSQCSTRIMTGCGVPTLQSLLDVQEYANNFNLNIIADGGIKNSGDIVKCFAAGANGVMLGSLLAATDETPGELTSNNTKLYRGSASASQKTENIGSAQNVEGSSIYIPSKGPVKNIIDKLSDGIRSGLSYLGFNSLQEMIEDINKDPNCVEFREISGRGFKESTPFGCEV